MSNIKMIKITKNQKEFFDKLEFVKKKYWHKTNRSLINYLLDISIEQNLLKQNV
jgi:hypothetical protein